VSNTPDEIISTILSRTQHVNIPKLTDDDIVVALLKDSNLEITQHDALNVARISNGSYLSALSILGEDDENKLNFERFVMIMRLAWQVGNRKDHTSLKTLKNGRMRWLGIGWARAPEKLFSLCPTYDPRKFYTQSATSGVKS